MGRKQRTFLNSRKDEDRRNMRTNIYRKFTLKTTGPGDLVFVMSAVFCYAELEIYYYYYYY